ncbi:MAG: aspartate/glutamate racemase family protein [Bacillota bacterium]
MRILVLNPNTTQAFTEAIGSTAVQAKSSGTDIICLNPLAGPRSIESDYDELLSVAPCLDVIIPRQADFDALVIACYGNHPVIPAAREILRQPVVGIMEASLHLACMVGHSFSIITSGDRAVTMFWRGVRALGLESQCASVRSTHTPVLALEGERKMDVRELILEEARKAIEDDGAEVISLGCAGMVGLAEQMTQKLGVPVIDGVAAGVRVAEALVGCDLHTSKRRAYAPLGEKEFVNMPSYLHNPVRPDKPDDTQEV